MTTRTTLQGCILAVITLIAAGLTSFMAQAAPVNTNAAKVLNRLSATDRGNVVLIQRRRREVRRGRRGRRAVRRGRRVIRRRRAIRRNRNIRRRVRRARRWGRRGRRYRRGNRWYFWAPWAGTYIYFRNYDACYRDCRYHGYSRGYCRELCAY